MTIFAAVLCAARSIHDQNGDRSSSSSVTTNTTCDVEQIDGLAGYFFEESCIAQLLCDDRAQIANFMDMFLAPLRAVFVFITICVNLLGYMALQLGMCVYVLVCGPRHSVPKLIISK